MCLLATEINIGTRYYIINKEILPNTATRYLVVYSSICFLDICYDGLNRHTQHYTQRLTIYTHLYYTHFTVLWFAFYCSCCSTQLHIHVTVCGNSLVIVCLFRVSSSFFPLFLPCITQWSDIFLLN